MKSKHVAVDVDWRLLAGMLALLLAAGGFFYFRDPAPRVLTAEETRRASEARDKFFAENPKAREAMEKRAIR